MNVQVLLNVFELARYVEHYWTCLWYLKFYMEHRTPAVIREYALTMNDWTRVLPLAMILNIQKKGGNINM